MKSLIKKLWKSMLTPTSSTGPGGHYSPTLTKNDIQEALKKIKIKMPASCAECIIAKTCPSTKGTDFCHASLWRHFILGF